MNSILIPVLIQTGLLVVLGIWLAFLLTREQRQKQEMEALRQSVNSLTSERDRILQEKTLLRSQFDTVSRELEGLRTRLKPIIDIDAERQRLIGEMEFDRNRLQEQTARIREGSEKAVKKFADQEAEARKSFLAAKDKCDLELKVLNSEIKKLKAEATDYAEQANLLSVGFYKPNYAFENSTQYKIQLEKIRQAQKRMIQNKTAATGAIDWTVNGSKAEGQKQINQTLKLMLRAFNGESDAAIAKVRFNNIIPMEARINRAHAAINSMAAVQQCSISKAYLEAKVKELRLAYEYQEKVQEEREEQARIREQMREEEKAQREWEKATQDAEKEEKRYQDLLRRATEEASVATGAQQARMMTQIEDLRRKLAEAQANKQRAISRAQMTRSGHVYVISNIGSFGEHTYKIGMTRRLEPLDRVKELGDASVPFVFDVHAVIYSDDAPALETILHQKFQHRRVNRMNHRKEFFHVTIDEIAKVVKAHQGDIEIVMEPEAQHYRQSIAALEDALKNGQKTVWHPPHFALPASNAYRSIT